MQRDTEKPSWIVICRQKEADKLTAKESDNKTDSSYADWKEKIEKQNCLPQRRQSVERME